MAYEVDISHVDTCLSCYVNDHCNGDNELLLGVAVDGSTTYQQVHDMLRDEWQVYGDKAPDEVTDEMFEKALAERFANVKMDTTFDDSIDILDEEDEPAGESCQAWFRVTWEEVDEDEASDDVAQAAATHEASGDWGGE